MSRRRTKNSWRKAIGAIKDSASVHLTRVRDGYKELDVSIVKATNHVERPANEKHIRAIFAAISATRPRADIAYCLHALERRLSKTSNWAVALKALIVIHRALREVDSTFQEELINYRMTRPTFLDLSYFKDYSSLNACDYSYWVRMYASYLDGRLQCFNVLKYDVNTEQPRTRDVDVHELFRHLPTLQTAIFRILCCKPEGAAVHNSVIRIALSMVASDSVKVYNAVRDGIFNLVDKFFEMKQHDGLKAVDMYRRAGAQAQSLSRFYETCKSLDVGCEEGFIEIEPPSSSFIQVMEEYLNYASRDSMVRFDENRNETLAIEYKNEAELQESNPSVPPAEPESVNVEARLADPLPDLLNLDDHIQETSELDQKNDTAMAIVPIPNQTASTSIDGALGWELALLTAPSSNYVATSSTKLGGGLDELTLNSLYDDAISRTNRFISYNPWDPQGSVPNSMMPAQTASNMFYGSNMMATPHNLQMTAMAQQQQQDFVLHQQEQQLMMMIRPPMPPQSSNPFANPYEWPFYIRIFEGS
ncbi:putative clathrin assembly protein At5g35200 [Rutidosis leptorrhynchoides]|uniref:putative clathrin assembly protein At5g35200 n=1 Tax=Rutidosis leptorrhynchoides TaxID=125765 RepID=UPI003A98E08D